MVRIVWHDVGAPLVFAFVAILTMGLVVGLGGVGRHGTGPLQHLDNWIYSLTPINRYHTMGPSLQIGHIFAVNVLGPIVVAVAFGMWLAGERFRSLVPVVAYLGAEFLVLLLKVAVKAPPPRAPKLLRTLGLAYPSGHATAAAAVAISLAPMAAARVHGRWPWAVALILGIVVGISRMTLAVHWFSDVAVGWFLGTLWGLSVAAVAAGRAGYGRGPSTTLGHRG